jgi:hypothetical protein
MDTERISLPLINSGNFNNLSSLFGNTKTLSGSNLGTIKLTGKNTISIKSTFDALDLIPELEELNKGKLVKSENFMKHLRSSRFDNSRYVDISRQVGSSVDLAKYSAHILKSTQWGDNTKNDTPSFYSGLNIPRKLGYKEIVKEVGKL